MKINVGEFEIDIKAKDTRFNDRNNMMDVINFLNETSIAFGRAAMDYNRKGYSALSENFQKKSDDIYAALKAAGAYKEV